MRGSQAECIRHLLKHVDDDNIRVLMEFVGIKSLKTVQEWREGERLPTGERALRLRVFLEAVGYVLPEMQPDRLSEPALRATRLIGYGVLGVGFVQSTLGYTELHALYRILEGHTPTRARAYQLEKLTRGTDKKLQRAMEAWEERISPLRRLVGISLVEQATDGNRPSAGSKSAPKGQEGTLQKPDDFDGSASALMHLIFASDALLWDASDLPAMARMIRARVAYKRLRALRDFLDQTLTD